MRVSIIIPVYNVEAYIVECLESVARQTYKGEMECLIVDDCGTDKSIANAENYINGYNGEIEFRILHHEHNRGLSAARNTGTEAATGDYIYYLDSDDAIIPETIEEMMRIVYQHPQVEMVQAGMVCMNGQIVEDFTQRDVPIYCDDAKWVAKNMFLRLPVSSCNRLLKKDFLLKENITFHEGIIHEDVPYYFQLSLKSQHVGFVKRNTYLFRSHREGSITTTPSQWERAMQSRILIMQDCIDAYQLFQQPCKTRRRCAQRAMWRKWLSYMVINQYETLLLHKNEIDNISRQLCAIAPGPWKIPAFLYSTLPIKTKQSKLFLKLLKRC